MLHKFLEKKKNRKFFKKAKRFVIFMCVFASCTIFIDPDPL